MEQLRSMIDKIIVLENKIGVLLAQKEAAIISDSKKDKRGYLHYLVQEIAKIEEERGQIMQDVLENYSYEDFNLIYEFVANEPKDENKIERLLIIFDLIEQKEMERGR